MVFNFDSKKGVSLPINMVVMMIIGIIIFALGMSLFSKMMGSGNEQIDDLNNKIVNDIASLECPGDDWICSPSNVMKNGENKVFQIYVANKADTQKTFKIDFPNLVDIDGKKGITKTSCGSIIVLYPQIETKIESGNSASFPFKVLATRIKKTPCSFVTSVKLLDHLNNEIGKTAVIVRVE